MRASLPGHGSRRVPGRVISVALLAVALTGCAAHANRACPGGEAWSIQDSLYFGTAMPGGVVSPDAWAQFLADTVTPRFPQGLTAWPASGQWRGADGEIVREASHVLLLVHPDDAASERAVQDIVQTYETRFQQEAVLRVSAKVCVAL